MKRIVFIIMILLFATSAYAAQVRVTWNANTEPDLDGYRVHYGVIPGEYTEIIDVGNMTEATIEITPEYGRDYYFVVTAYDTSGNESGYSDMASCFIPDATPPEKPKNILVRIIEAIMAFFKGLFFSDGSIA